MYGCVLVSLLGELANRRVEKLVKTLLEGATQSGAAAAQGALSVFVCCASRGHQVQCVMLSTGNMDAHMGVSVDGQPHAAQQQHSENAQANHNFRHVWGVLPIRAHQCASGLWGVHAWQ